MRPSRSPTSSRSTSCGWTRKPMLPGRPYVIKAGTTTVPGTIETIKHKVNVNTMEHVAAKTPRAQRDRRLQPRTRHADRLRALQGEPPPRVLHHHRPLLQQHGRHGPHPLRAAPRRQHPLAGARREQGVARRPRGPEARRPVVHRTFGCRQVDHRQSRREEAARRRPHDLSARRRQCPPRPEPRPRLHRCRPRREHPPRRRSGEADGRCRA